MQKQRVMPLAKKCILVQMWPKRTVIRRTSGCCNFLPSIYRKMRGSDVSDTDKSILQLRMRISDV